MDIAGLGGTRRVPLDDFIVDAYTTQLDPSEMVTGLRIRIPPAGSGGAYAKFEKRAGDFLDYYAEVLRLSQEYAAHPDSFRAALDSLPGSHLTEKEWDVWIAPYRDDPRTTSDRLEKIIAGLKTRLK